jgi:hypothetical protein
MFWFISRRGRPVSSAERAAIEALLDGDEARRLEAMGSMNVDRASRLMMLALANACHLQFPEGASIDGIAEYVQQLYSQEPATPDLKIVPTEYVIRAVLVDSSWLKGVPAVDLLAAQMAVVHAVAEERKLVGIARKDFIDRTLKEVR